MSERSSRRRRPPAALYRRLGLAPSATIDEILQRLPPGRPDDEGLDRLSKDDVKRIVVENWPSAAASGPSVGVRRRPPGPARRRVGLRLARPSLMGLTQVLGTALALAAVLALSGLVSGSLSKLLGPISLPSSPRLTPEQRGVVDELHRLQRERVAGEARRIETTPGATTSPSAYEWSAIRLGDMRFPAEVAVDDRGNIYVTADRSDERILKFSPDGELLVQWGVKTSQGTPLAAPFRYPRGIAVDAQGYIYAVDAGNHSIVKMAPDGEILARWGAQGIGPGQFMQPHSIALDRQSGSIYVTDVGPGAHCVIKLSLDGKEIGRWGAQGAAPGRFNYPRGIAVDARGYIYVADDGNHRIQKLSPTGALVAHWGTRGSDPGQLWEPGGVAVDQQGNIYVADTRNRRIQKWSPDGELLSMWGSGLGTAFGELGQPRGIAVDEQGTLYVADNYNGRIMRLSAGPK
jgi:DNA-binding beta-propeller fold protein YncE